MDGGVSKTLGGVLLCKTLGGGIDKDVNSSALFANAKGLARTLQIENSNIPVCGISA
jgi:hypothetical protein